MYRRRHVARESCDFRIIASTDPVHARSVSFRMRWDGNVLIESVTVHHCAQKRPPSLGKSLQEPKG